MTKEGVQGGAVALSAQIDARRWWPSARLRDSNTLCRHLTRTPRAGRSLGRRIKYERVQVNSSRVLNSSDHFIVVRIGLIITLICSHSGRRCQLTTIHR